LNANHVPNRITLLDAPWHSQDNLRDIAVYAQDQWTVKAFTLNLGLRYGDAKASTPKQVLGAGFWVPERVLEATDDVPHWKNLSPRMGVAYDLFGNGKTALKASIGHYPDRVIAASANPAANLARTTFISWTDTDGDFIPDCNLHNPAGESLGDVCGPWQTTNFGQPRLDTTYSDEAKTGFNKQSHQWQSSVSIQHQLRPGMGLNVGWFRTWYGGFLVTDNPALDPSSYDPYCITAPTSDKLPEGISGARLCGFYDLKPQFFGATGGVVKQASSFGKRTQVFNGVDITTNARFGQGGQLSGGLSMGRTVTDNCIIVDSPQDARPGFCKTTPPWSASTQIKFLLVYPLPYDIQTSVIYQNVPAIPRTTSYVATNADIRQTLGRDLTACRGAVNCTETVTVQLYPTTTLYEKRLSQLDLRLSRIFHMGGTRKLRGSLDLLNLLNANTVLKINDRFGPSWQNVLQTLTGRLIKIGTQIDF
jgi:hypothetical protein